MQNKVLIGIIVAVIIVGAWLAWSQAENGRMESEKMMQEGMEGGKMENGTPAMNEDAMKKDDGMGQEGAMMQKGGTYEAYDASKLALAKEGKVVLFFRAGWCPTCRALDADIKANMADIPSGVTVLDVNYDASADLKAKYGVTTQHTLVQVDENGNQIAKWIGSPSLSDLLTKVK